ncbi:MAG: hypothetical protein WCI73_07360, partial [Phycisphaerae bacterium]
MANRFLGTLVRFCHLGAAVLVLAVTAYARGQTGGCLITPSGAAVTAHAHGQTKLDLQDRWFYCATNLLVDKNVDDLAGLFRRAGVAGYNGVLLS